MMVIYGSSLALRPLSEDEFSGAAEGDVEDEDDAEDEGEGAEEDGAVVGVQVGEERGGGEEAAERTGARKSHLKILKTMS